MLAADYRRSGEHAKAGTILARLESLGHSAISDFGRGTYHMLCHEFDQAAECFPKALDGRHFAVLGLASNPLYAEFRETRVGGRCWRKGTFRILLPYRISIYTLVVKSLLIQLDEPLLRQLNRVAPTAQRKRAEFVRAAIRKAIYDAEEERTRLAYLKQPDTETAADDWSHAEEWKP